MGLTRGKHIVGWDWRRRDRPTRDQPPTGRGQALVEFALVVPILAILFAAVVQFASIYERQIGIENAAREVGRRAAALPTNDGTAANNAFWAYNQLTCISSSTPGDPCFNFTGLLASNVQAYSGDPSTLNTAQICYSNAPDLDPSGNKYIVVDVTIKYAHPMFMPLVSGFFNGIITTHVTFRVEGDAGGPLTSSPACWTP